MTELDETMFNAPQMEAIRYQDGPSLVVAGAGSGKTRVLTYKIAYLIGQGFRPWNILALTFTNKAAGEMKARIAQVVGEEMARRLWMGTFHSVFLRILRAELPLLEESDPLWFPHNFTIYDQDDSKSLVRSILHEMQLDDKTYRPGTVQGRISDVKNRLMGAEEYAASGAWYEYDMKNNMPLMRDVFMRYQQRCRRAAAMDFDDILMFTYRLFDQHPEILSKYQQRFSYVLVDEYQDTNFAQHQIILQLAALPPHRVCVVGDDAQSIYSFRGANIDNILGFNNAYPDCNVRLFKLEQNYRSTQNIVNAANSLIHKNQGQIHKEVFSKNESGDKIHVCEAYSDIEEAQIIVNTVKRQMRQSNIQPADIAVLYRTNAQSRVIEEAMRKAAIPYKVYGGVSFYQRKEVKDVIAYMRLAVNPHDEEALRRVINTPARGIGATTMAKISSAALTAEESLWTVINDVAKYDIGINRRTIDKLNAFASIIQTFINKADDEDAETLGRLILTDSGLQAEIFADTSPEGLSRQENIKELVVALHDFVEIRQEEGNENVGIAEYLSEVALMSDQDRDASDSDNGRVTLMTIHSAKGLEFDTVVVAGLEENLFPNQMSMNSPREMEEERRLCYVAMTRAKHHLYLTYARSRYRFGQMEFSNPSRFVSDIDHQYLTFKNEKQERSMFGNSGRGGMKRFDFSELSSDRGGAKHSDFGEIKRLTTRPGAQQLRRLIIPEGTRGDFQNPPSVTSAKTSGGQAVEVGKHIVHERFGRGLVTAIDGSGDNCRMTVKFENTGVKVLMLKFAHFDVED